MGKKKVFLIASISAVVVVFSIISYVLYTSYTHRPAFEQYSSTFHLLFEDGSLNLLGNLTGRISIEESEKGVAHATCELSFLSDGSIDKIELITCFMPFIFYEGPTPISIPLPPVKTISLHSGERMVIAEVSRDISGLEEPMVVFGFTAGSHVRTPEGDEFRIPMIKLYFTDGRIWKWEYKFNETRPFPLWSGIRDWKLSELSGRTEREHYVIVTLPS